MFFSLFFVNYQYRAGMYFEKLVHLSRTDWQVGVQYSLAPYFSYMLYWVLREQSKPIRINGSPRS